MGTLNYQPIPITGNDVIADEYEAKFLSLT